jgi:hypothetical protein
VVKIGNEISWLSVVSHLGIIIVGRLASWVGNKLLVGLLSSICSPICFHPKFLNNLFLINKLHLSSWVGIHPNVFGANCSFVFAKCLLD